MLTGLPFYVYSMFSLALVMGCIIMVQGSGKKKWVVASVLLAWIGIQSAMALSGFYQNIDAIPPRFIFLIGPPLLAIIIIFLTNKRHHYLDSVDIQWLAWIHIIRIQAELVLFWLYKDGHLPEIMTFTGYNYDILAGVTAPIATLLSFTKKKVVRVNLLLGWNIFALLLLGNIVVTAVLSAEVPFQMLSFDQPNRAVTYFPFNLLPALIVPLVLFAHLASIRKLLIQRRDERVKQLLEA